MLPPFDLFRRYSEEDVLWVGIASSMEEAEEKIAKEVKQAPADYLIVSLATGNRRLVSKRIGT
jgi:hypothetical protein